VLGERGRTARVQDHGVVETDMARVAHDGAGEHAAASRAHTRDLTTFLLLAAIAQLDECAPGESIAGDDCTS
jgi:hypothetical protein